MRNLFLEILEKRRSVRKFTSEHVKDEDLDYILQAGKMAPTGKNRQPLLFVVLKSDGVKQRYVERITKTLARPISPYYDSDVIILVFGRSTNTVLLDGAAAVENMLLAATATDLGACWIHASYEFFMTQEGKEFMASINVDPNEYEGLESIALGVSDGELPVAKERKEETRII